MQEKRLLRIGEVIRRTGLSKSEIYRRVQDNRFPPQIRISYRVAAWQESAVNAWVENPV